MSSEVFVISKGLEIDAEIIDAVFDFMDECHDEGYNAAQIMVAMLCVVQMIQESSVNGSTVH
jgi:hypothetical protein